MSPAGSGAIGSNATGSNATGSTDPGTGMGVPGPDAEDAKLITLARGARARTGAAEGAAVRDGDGRTYAAATVGLPSLRLTAAQAAIAAAVSSGADALEALAVVGGANDLDPPSAAAAADLGTEVVILAAPDGTVRSRTRA